MIYYILIKIDKSVKRSHLRARQTRMID